MSSFSPFGHRWSTVCGRIALLLAVVLAAVMLPATGTADTAEPEDLARFVIDGKPYVFSNDEIPVTSAAADDPLRHVYFGNRVTLGYTGVSADRDHPMVLTFLAERERTLRITTADAVLADKLIIHPGTIYRQAITVPRSAILDGAFELRIKCLAGPNAVVSAARFTDPADARVTPIPDPAAFTAARLKKAIAALPWQTPRLSPIPTTVVGVAQPVMSLNGTWKFNPQAPSEDQRGWPIDHWADISVPGEWVMQGFAVPPATWCAYARDADLPADWANHRVKLRFDSVNSECRVSINGKPAGVHEGGFVPFELDITDLLHTGRNRIGVEVKADGLTDTLGSISQYAAHSVGGMLRKVQLLALPEHNISAESVTTEVNPDNTGAALHVSVQSLTERIGPAAEAVEARTDTHITLQLFAPDGSKIALPGAASGGGLLPNYGLSFTSAVLPVRLWDSEHPVLYRLQTSLYQGQQKLEVVNQRVGFRKVDLAGNQLLINHQPVKLLGVCRHEISPVTGRSVSPELCRQDARLFRDANCNYIRTSHYPPSEEFLDAADELGLFVESESALCWIQHNANPIWKTWDYDDPGLLRYLWQANLEKMTADRQHPSVIIWSLANESYWSPLWAEIDRRVRALDPTRPTTFHDQCWGNYNNNHSTAMIGVYHYPGETGPARCDKETRPILFGEYAHVECYNRRELVTDPGIREDWGRPFETMVDQMQSHPGCLGGAIWSGIDDIFNLPDGRQIGYGPWGIIDGYRRKKPEYWLVTKAYSPIRVNNTNVPVTVEQGVIRLPVENRYNFTNLREVKIAWSLGSRSGLLSADIAPRHQGTLVIPVGTATAADDADHLNITFIDPRAYVSDIESLPLVKNRPATQPLNASNWSLAQSDAAFSFTRDGTDFTIDRANGNISAADAGHHSLLQAIDLMILPLNDDSGGDGGIAGNDFQKTIAPFNPLCTNWQCSKVSIDQQVDGAAIVTVTGKYAEASGQFQLRFDRDAAIHIAYDFSVNQKLNPRQWGPVLKLQRALDTLHWKRLAQWTVYGAGDLGRAEGMAVAAPGDRTDPTGLWALDATALGSNDFRATHYHVTQAALTDATGRGLQVQSDGTASCRSWVDGDSIRWLIAGFHTGGADGFFAGHFARERRPLQAGSHITGHFDLQIIHSGVPWK